VDEPTRTLQWKALSGEERYRVVEMARKGEVAISELCCNPSDYSERLFHFVVCDGIGDVA